MLCFEKKWYRICHWKGDDAINHILERTKPNCLWVWCFFQMFRGRGSSVVAMEPADASSIPGPGIGIRGKNLATPSVRGWGEAHVQRNKRADWSGSKVSVSSKSILEKSFKGLHRGKKYAQKIGYKNLSKQIHIQPIQPIVRVGLFKIQDTQRRNFEERKRRKSCRIKLSFSGPTRCDALLQRNGGNLRPQVYCTTSSEVDWWEVGISVRRWNTHTHTRTHTCTCIHTHSPSLCLRVTPHPHTLIQTH